MFASRAVTVIAAAAIAITAADTGIAITRSASHDSDTPSESLAKAFARALAQGTVHSQARTTSTTGATTTFDNYDGEHVGEQHITINGGHLEVRVIGSTTYLTGDAKGLAVYGVDARQLHGQWLPLVAAQRGYGSVTAGVTLASALDADKIAGPLRREPDKTIDGQPVYGIAGHGDGANSPSGSASTIWISKDTGLPVEFDATTATTTITETFSDWGEPIHVATPSNVFGQTTI